MKESEIRKIVLLELRKVAPEVDPAKLDPARSFRDQVEVDSVDFLTLMLALEESLGASIPETDYPKLSSLQGCVGYLARLSSAGNHGK